MRAHRRAFIFPFSPQSLGICTFAMPVPRLAALRNLIVSPRVPRARSRIAPCALRAEVSEKEYAFIFQRSPYHVHRSRLYSSTSNDSQAVSTLEPEAPHASGSRQAMGEDRIRDVGEEILVLEKAQRRIRERVAMHNITKTGGENGLSIADDNMQEETPLSLSKPSSSSLHFATHQEFVEAMYALTGDPLESDGGRIVVYRGNPKARIMIIGEAPGKEEDLQGKPFVGEAGQLLDKIFAYGGFDMESQVYITNVSKRRPAENRTPTEEEVEFYIPYLTEEIRLIAPKIIVLAGGVAARAMLGSEARITKIRGEWFTYDEDVAMMPVFHPAYLLRRRSAKYDMVVDIEEIRAKYLHEVPEDKLKPLIKNIRSSRR